MRMIEVEDLVKQYDKAKTSSVKDVGFAVDEGEFYR